MDEFASHYVEPTDMLAAYETFARAAETKALDSVTGR